jgi:hypothetical protein
MMRRSLRSASLVVSLAVLVPATVRAQQASITGVVGDTSGAVPPGVTVEAASPALIEYGTRYLTPTLVLPARFAKVSAQFDF